MHGTVEEPYILKVQAKMTLSEWECRGSFSYCQNRPIVQTAQVMQSSELPGRLNHCPLCAPTQPGAAVALHEQGVVKS